MKCCEYGPRPSVKHPPLKSVKLKCVCDVTEPKWTVGKDHRHLREVDCSRHISLKKIHLKNKNPNSRHKKGRQASKLAIWQAGRLAGWQAGRLAGWQAGRLAGWQIGRLAGLQGWQARLIDVPTLTDNIFAAATNRTNIHNMPLISLYNEITIIRKLLLSL